MAGVRGQAMCKFVLAICNDSRQNAEAHSMGKTPQWLLYQVNTGLVIGSKTKE